MTARGELLKKLFLSYSRRDGTGFRDVALEIITDEERRNNRVLANALRRSLDYQFPGSSSQRRLEVIPFEKDKQLPLVEEIKPERRAGDIVFSRENQQLLLSVLEEFRRNELIRSHGLRVRSKLLFCGPPGCLLQLIDKYGGTGFIIAATNHEKQLDSAIWRRFDEIVYFSLPTRTEVAGLLKLMFKNFKADFSVENKIDCWPSFSHAARSSSKGRQGANVQM